MATVDSKTVFVARLAELGLGGLKDKFIAQGWCTFADFAFATSDFKGTDPALFEKDVIKPLVGEDTVRVPKIRRLFMQSYMLAAADLERYGQAPESSKATHSLHPEDRAVRMTALKERITGFDIAGPSEPSHALVDLFNSILVSGAVRYVAWERCASRAAEAQLEPEGPGLKLNADGVFVRADVRHAIAELDGELRWDYALRRRNLAMDLAGLCKYEAAGLWTEVMKKSYLAKVLPGTRRVSWAQLLEADKALFTYVAENCPNGCKAKPGGTTTEFEVAWGEGHD